MVSRIGISTRFRNGQMFHRTGPGGDWAVRARGWDDDNSRCRGPSPLLNIDERNPNKPNRAGIPTEALVATLVAEGLA